MLLAEVVDRNRGEIERRWLARVQADVANVQGVQLTQLRDGMPDYLAAMVELLRRGSAEGELERRSGQAWAEVAREHGITRVRLGFNIAQLIHEFIVLRHIIRDVAREEGLAEACPDALLADIFDAAIVTSVRAYVNARDFEARRAQAENIGFLTHELRNPLSTAMVTASHLRGHASPEQVPKFEILERSHNRLRDLIDSVLLTGRLEAGSVRAQPRDVELGSVLGPALESAEIVARGKGLELHVSYEPKLVVRLDPLLTRSAVQNLVDNAAKYTGSGRIELAAENRATELVVHVRDTCQGLSPEELRTIFEPFRRGRSSQPGTGLGLAIARRAIEAQGGTMGAESPGAAGCHFWFTLPTSGEISTKGPLPDGTDSPRER